MLFKKNFLKILLSKKSILRTSGWYNSVRNRHSCDEAGNILPWFTYAALDFLKTRNLGDLKVLEYGSGNSTKWWADNTSSVVAVEHVKDWVEKIASKLPSNAQVKYVDIGDDIRKKYLDIAFGQTSIENEYVNAVEFSSADIIVIDGVYRNGCCRSAIKFAGPYSVIIYDNTDFEESQLGVDLLKKAGWRVIPFTGLGGNNPFRSETSIDYRDNNCLGI
jgi:hypothetical protein